MEKSSNLLLKLSRSLFADTAEQEKFIQAVINPQAFNPAILWLQPKPTENPFTVEISVSWQPEFVDRLALESKPGKHSLHQAGHYYCLDFSSIFATSTLLTIPQPIKLISDMCVAPGRKSVFSGKTLNPELLFCNEATGKRMGMLISNLKRCQIQPSAAANVDSKILAEEIPQTANLVIIVDAPCTGQSLLAKGDKAPECFHHVTINSNANRQKRILANSAKIVASQGYIAYMTCTYSTA